MFFAVVFFINYITALPRLLFFERFLNVLIIIFSKLASNCNGLSLDFWIIIMIHGQPTHWPLQFEAYLERIIIRTFEMRSKNTSCEKAILYNLYLLFYFRYFVSEKSYFCSKVLKNPVLWHHLKKTSVLNILVVK